MFAGRSSPGEDPLRWSDYWLWWHNVGVKEGNESGLKRVETLAQSRSIQRKTDTGLRVEEESEPVLKWVV